MSESSTPSEHDSADDDAVRQHTQTDTEGGDATDEGEDVPREHSEDPAEG
jgi:hypothetical protein